MEIAAILRLPNVFPGFGPGIIDHQAVEKIWNYVNVACLTASILGIKGARAGEKSK